MRPTHLYLRQSVTPAKHLDGLRIRARCSLGVAVAFLACVACPSCTGTEAGAIDGNAKVIDGDSLEIRGERIRLYGIDAPESRQECVVDGQPWCGRQAKQALEDKIQRRRVRCERKDTDKYDRMVAVCFVGDLDLNRWLVSEGWALAYGHYSTDYVEEEAAARAAGRGVWGGTLAESPSDWRKTHQRDAAPEKDRHDCQIKGNISKSGRRIYHMPGSPAYTGTRIETRKGERWFCTETEAIAAGWAAPDSAR